MAKPLILTLNGTTIGTAAQRGVVDIVATPFTAALTKRGVNVSAVQPGFLWAKARYSYYFPFDESTFERIDSGRSAGKAAIGAIAGTLLAGPLGLIAGAALGGGKKHIVAIQHTDIQASLVLELSSSELQVLVGRGLLGAS